MVDAALAGVHGDYPEVELAIESSLQVLDFDNDAVHAGVRAPMIHVSSFPLAWPEWLRQAGAGDVQAKQTV